MLFFFVGVCGKIPCVLFRVYGLVHTLELPRKKKAAVLALKFIRIVNAKTRANKQHSNAELEFSLLFNKEEEEEKQ